MLLRVCSGKFRQVNVIDAVIVSCSGNVEIVTVVFGHEKNVFCWAFLGMHCRYGVLIWA
jgi:hypothetical protein